MIKNLYPLELSESGNAHGILKLYFLFPSKYTHINSNPHGFVMKIKSPP